MEHRGFYDRIAQRLFKRPRISHISLDRYSSAVWQSMDGENTVGDIVDIMKKRFPGEEERMLDRIVTFLATLQRNGFITIRGDVNFSAVHRRYRVRTRRKKCRLTAFSHCYIIL